MNHHNFESASSYKEALCNNRYIPSTVEYMQGLGVYGIWLLIIGGISTLLLFSIFLEQVFFSQSGVHRVFRRHIYWIASVYPFMTFMSLVSVVIPRAHNICTSVKTTYMAIGIGHFIDLTVLMYGSEEVILATMSNHRLDIQLGPVCCCCCCLPSPKITKMPLRMTIFLCDQLAFAQAFYYITLLVLVAGDNIVLGDVSPDSPYLWLSLMNMVSFMSGIWGLRILAKMSNDHLKHYNYNNKAFSMKTLILVTNFQTFILQILGNYNVFPCIPPFISPQVFRQTVENSLYFLEMLILGCYTYYQYHNHEFLIPNPTEVVTDERHERSATVSTCISATTECTDIGQCDTNQLSVIVEEPVRIATLSALESEITFCPEKPDDSCTRSPYNPREGTTRQQVQKNNNCQYIQLTSENHGDSEDNSQSSTSTV